MESSIITYNIFRQRRKRNSRDSKLYIPQKPCSNQKMKDSDLTQKGASVVTGPVNSPPSPPSSYRAESLMVTPASSRSRAAPWIFAAASRFFSSCRSRPWSARPPPNSSGVAHDPSWGGIFSAVQSDISPSEASFPSGAGNRDMEEFWG